MLQIGCAKFACMKAVEVCYWSCKFRKNCKDWHAALIEQPGIEAISRQLIEASKKSGRVFDPQTMVLMKKKEKREKREKPEETTDRKGGTKPATLPF